MRKSKLRELLVSYERRRDRAESDLEDRKKDVYNQIPEIKNIDNEVASLGLKLARLVKSKKVGKEVYYSLSDSHVKEIIEVGKEHVLEE